MLSRTPWIQVPVPRAQARLRLYCFPYAGGGVAVYRAWSDSLDEQIEVRAVALPGRERRFGEPALSSVETIADQLIPALLPELDRPFAVFGHSLGALLGFEVSRRLARAGHGPVRLLVSAASAPHVPPLGLRSHRLPDAAFLRCIQELGGTPPELTENTALMELLLPMLRADFTAAETYRVPVGEPLTCPITAFAGADDPLVDRLGLEAWSVHTAESFRLHELPGSHFFLATARPALLELVSRELSGHK